MPPPRIEVVDFSYHVNSNAVDGTRLYRDDIDRLAFRTLLEKEAVRSDWCVLAYSLMTTHFHVVMRLRKLTLSSGFQNLKSVYALIQPSPRKTRSALAAAIPRLDRRSRASSLRVDPLRGAERASREHVRATGRLAVGELR